MTDLTVAFLRLSGHRVATNVSIQLQSPENVRLIAVADYIVTDADSRFILLGEVKTGGARLSRNQRLVYQTGAIVQIKGDNASSIGLPAGTLFPALFLGENRFPGC